MGSPITRISVCIPSVRAEPLRATIASILKQTWSELELVVVGQGTDTSVRAVAESIAKRDARVRYVHSPRRGASAARNKGIQAAEGDVIAMTDDDCVARADWLAVIAGSFSADPDLGLVGGAFLADSEITATNEQVGVTPSPETRLTATSLSSFSTCGRCVPAEVLYDPAATPPPAPSGFDWYGANFAVRRSIASRVGPLDELLGPGATFPSAEDVDYKLRLEAAEVKMLSTPRSVVFHKYGRRYGLTAVTRYWRGQDAGTAAVAAKLTLRGDPRGREWLRKKFREYSVGFLQEPRPHKFLANPIRLHAFVRAYWHCVRTFELDDDGLLRQRRDGGDGAAPDSRGG